MPESKYDYLKDLDIDFLAKFARKTKLLRLRRYTTKQDFVLGLSRSLSSDQCKFITNLISEGYNAVEVADRFLLEMSTNADIIKKFYVEYLFKNEVKKITEDVIFFEFGTGNSRTDLN